MSVVFIIASSSSSCNKQTNVTIAFNYYNNMRQKTKTNVVS